MFFVSFDKSFYHFEEEILMRSQVAKVSPVVRMAEIKDQQIQEILEYNERKKSPFRKWVQMNYDDNAYQADDFLVANSSTAYRIFKFLIANMDKYNAVIVSYKVIQQVFGYGQATVARAVKFLKDHNYIEVVRTGGANIYTINKHLYWNSWGTNYEYAEFDAHVIITSSEQDKQTQAKIRTQVKKRQEVIQSPPTFQEQIRQAKAMDNAE